MALICWICNTPLTEDEARVTPRRLPHRLRRYREQPVHLRCFDSRDETMASARLPSAGSVRGVRPAHAIKGSGLLFAEDLAVLRRISRHTAWRWLVRLEEEFGEAAVGRVRGRRGPRRFVTADALARITSRLGTRPCGT